MIKNMNYKLLLVCTVVIQIGWAKSDCESGLLKCFGESVGNLTKMYEDANTDVIFNFKIDVSAMNASDIRNLLIASNASLFSDRIDFVDGAAPSRTTIVQLAEVLRNELKKNDVDLTESKLFMKVNNYSTIEVQIFDFIDEEDDSVEESIEDSVDNSTLILNVNIVMKNSTVNLMDDKGEKISTNENDDYVYVDLQERLEFGTNETSKNEKANKEHEKWNNKEKEKLLKFDTDAVEKYKQEDHVKWNKGEHEKLLKFDADAVIKAKKAELKQWTLEEKDKLHLFDTGAVIKAKKAEYEQWSKDEQKKLLGFDADALIKAKKAEYEQWNKEEQKKILEFDTDAVIKAKGAEHRQWNKDEKDKLMKFDVDAVIRAKKAEHEQWNQDEKDKLFKFDTDALLKAKIAEHKQWTKEEEEKLLGFDTNVSKKAKNEENDKSKRNEKENVFKENMFNKFEEIMNDAKEKTQEENENWNGGKKEKILEFYHTQGMDKKNLSIRQGYQGNNNKEILRFQKVQENSKLENTNKEPVKDYKYGLKPDSPIVELQNPKNEHENSAESEKDMEYDIIEENIEKNEKNSKIQKYKEENIYEERQKKDDISQKEIIKEHEQWNKTIQEKLKELEKIEEQEIEIVTENMAIYQKEMEKHHEKEMELTDLKDLEVEIVTEKKLMKNQKLSITPKTTTIAITTIKKSDHGSSKTEDQDQGEENDSVKKFKELERKIQEQKELILKLQRLQKVKEQHMNEKYNKLKLGQMEDDEFTTALPSETNDNEKAKIIEDDLLFKANLKLNKAKMVYHVVTERITSPPSIKELEKEEEDLNPIDGFYYDMNEDNQTSDYLSINYLDLYKDTTNEDIPYTTLPPALFVTHKFMESIVEEQKIDDTAQEIKGLLDVAKDNIGLRRALITPSEQHYSCNTNVTKEDLADVVFPWIAAVFIRNGTTNAFEYVCDGAVISDRAVITAGHCLSPDSMPRPPRDVIVILGKRNQRDMTSNDIHKVSEISVNAYYSVIGNHISHDLAILKLETPTVLDESVDAACTLDFDLTDTDTVVDAITTGWNDNGELTPIHFETLHNVQNNTFCLRDYAYQHVFCDTIGFDVQICPSYGGIYAIKLSNHNWYLKGILSADTSKKGVCVDRNLRFTNLGESEYKNWLRNVMKV